MPTWDDLKKPERAPDSDRDGYARLCLGAFGTAAGRELLQYLHSRYIDAVLPGSPDERALVAFNAKRQIVRELEEQVARGLAALKKDETK